MRRLILAAIALTLLLAAPAAAKVWFQQMGGRTVHWDQRVVTTIAGCPGNDGCLQGLDGTPVALRRVGGKARHALGRIRGGRLRFRVPHLKPGRYRLIAEGRAVSMPFRIRAG